MNLANEKTNQKTRSTKSITKTKSSIKNIKNKHREHRKKLLTALSVLLLVFAAFFIAALLSLNKRSVIGLNIDITMENGLVMLLSILGIVKTLHEIHKV